jgi:hypothetical protein
MSDIVERLRRVAKELPQTSGNQAWLKPEDTTVWESADEIEKLRAENARMRGVLAKTTKILVAAFNRIHGLPRTTDTELSTEIEKCLGEIRRVREETQ